MIVRHLALAGALPPLLISLVTGVVRVNAQERIAFDDRVSRSRYDYLTERSPTMRQMVRVIEAAPDVHVRVRAVPGLGESSRYASHGMISIGDGSIHAVLEFDSVFAKLFTQVEMLAHEVAHVVEVVCLPRVATAGELGALLAARGFGGRQLRWGRIGIETRFAAEAGRRVALEAMRRSTDMSRLPVLAQRHALGGLCIEPDSRPPRATATH